MQTTTFNPVENITCFDLENTTLENLVQHAFHVGLCDMQLALLKEQFEQTQLKKANKAAVFLRKIYADGDVIILGSTTDCIDLIAPFLEIELDSIKSVPLPQNFNYNMLFDFSTATFEALEQATIKQNPNLMFGYQHDFIHLESSNVNLKPSVIENELKTTLTFCDELSNDKLKSLHLTNLFFKKRVPVAFYFQTATSTDKYLSWNAGFLQSILDIKPINTSSVNRAVVLNTILDKINSNGIQSLTLTQKDFLAHYNQIIEK